MLPLNLQAGYTNTYTCNTPQVYSQIPMKNQQTTNYNIHPPVHTLKAVNGEKNWVIIIIGYIFSLLSILAYLFLMYAFFWLIIGIGNGTYSEPALLTTEIILFPLLCLGVFGLVIDYMMTCVDYTMFLLVRKMAFGGLIALGVLISGFLLAGAFVASGWFEGFLMIGCGITICQAPLFLFAAYAFHSPAPAAVIYY